MFAPGRLTILTAAITWNGTAGEAVVEPPQFGRYAILSMAARGAALTTGRTCIVTEIKDVRRSRDYILSADASLTPARGVPLRHLAGIGNDRGPLWAGDYLRTIDFIRSQIGDAGARRAALSIERWFGRPQAPTCYIPMDGDIRIRLTNLASGDQPTSLGLVVVDLGEGDSVGWTEADLPAFGLPRWFSFPTIALATGAAVSQLQTATLSVPSSAYTWNRQKGALQHRQAFGSVFLDSDGSLSDLIPTQLEINTQQQDKGEVRFDTPSGYVPLAYAANPGLELPAWDKRFQDKDQLALNWQKDTTAAASKLWWTMQFVAVE